MKPADSPATSWLDSTSASATCLLPGRFARCCARCPGPPEGPGVDPFVEDLLRVSSICDSCLSPPKKRTMSNWPVAKCTEATQNRPVCVAFKRPPAQRSDRPGALSPVHSVVCKRLKLPMTSSGPAAQHVDASVDLATKRSSSCFEESLAQRLDNLHHV